MSAERWEAIKAKVAEIGRAHARAGIIGAEARQQHTDSDLTNAEIATIHEFGSPSKGLPERSFIRSTIRDRSVEAEFQALAERIVKAVILGKMDRDRALGLLGAWAAGKIQERITSDAVRPELRPATIEAKGHDRVLIDTGQLVRAISFEVVK